jgi:hypothetical protein
MEQVAATALQEFKVTSKKELLQRLAETPGAPTFGGEPLANAGVPLVPVQEIEDVIKLILQFR